MSHLAMIRRHCTSRRLLRSAATLVEVAVSTVLVGVVVIAAIDTLGGAVRAHREAATGSEAHRLAEQLLTEILATPYEDPDGPPINTLGPEADEPGSPTNRLVQDDIDDFHGWNRSPPMARDGTPLAGYTGWSRMAQIQFVNPTPDGDSRLQGYGVDTGLKRVLVSVTFPSGEYLTTSALCTRYGVSDAPPALDAQWVTAIEVTANVGNGGEVRDRATLLNEAEVPQ